MCDDTHPYRRRSRAFPSTRSFSAVALAALWLCSAWLAACGGSTQRVTSPTPISPTPLSPAFGPVEPALVGNWNGIVDGSFGPGTFSMTLLADGSIRTSGSGNYCAFTGTWGVTSGQFKTGGPDCTGTIVQLTAPVLSNTSLSGTWSASSGRSGTFTCTKE
jgi:hypothetical protein